MFLINKLFHILEPLESKNEYFSQTLYRNIVRIYNNKKKHLFQKIDDNNNRILKCTFPVLVFNSLTFYTHLTCK